MESGRRVVVCCIFALLVTGVWSRFLEEDELSMVTDSMTSAIATGGPRQQACIECQKFAAQLSLALNDPDTVDEILAIVEALACSHVPVALTKACVEVISDYAPQAIDAIKNSLDLDTICDEMKICKSTANSLAIPVDDTDSLAITPKCQFCMQLAYEVVVALEDNKTQSEVRLVLHKACEKVKNAVLQEQCIALVDVYFQQFVMILQTLSPEEFCQAIKYCGSSEVFQAIGGGLSQVMQEQNIKLISLRAQNVAGTAQECAACRIAIAQAKKKLKDPAVQEKLYNFLLTVCAKAEPAAQAQCKASVEEYLPIVFANIDVLDPFTLCRKATLCPAADAYSSQAELPAVM